MKACKADNRPFLRSTWIDSIHSRLRSEELRRRLLHMSPGVFPYILYFVPQKDPIEATALWIVCGLCTAGAIGALSLGRIFRREGEHGWTISVLSYLAIAPLLLYLFPDKSEIAGSVVSIIAFGDSAATTVGLLNGGRRLPWNPVKSWAGSAAFVAGALPFAVFSFWIQARPSIPLATALECVAPAVFLAAIAESLCSRVNDNLRIGLTA